MNQQIRQWLFNEGYNKHLEFDLLSNEKSKLDPEDAPYASKYKAREILKSMKCKIEDLLEDGEIALSNSNNIEDIQDVNNVLNLISPAHLLCVLNYELGVNYVECEEVPTGQEYLEKCLELIDSKSLMPSWCSLSISVNNQLGILWSNRCSYEEALKYLKISEDLYLNFKKDENKRSPLDYNTFWKRPVDLVESCETFEDLHTHTLYYLAQAYGIRGETKISSKYCHITLARQMKAKQYDPMDWSLNCATLSQYYVTQDQYNYARYCLACAELVNQEVFQKLSKMVFSEKNERERTEEKMYKSKADVFRCWAKYGLNLIKSAHSAKTGDEKNFSINEEILDEENSDFKALRFDTLEVDIYEEQVSDQLPQTYAEAKSVFLFSQKCLDKSKEFYKLDGYVSAFVEITQDVSQLYKYLAFFDDSFENRCKMHKRRIDMLNEILVELNPQHFLIICRQLTFEIAETYNEMAQLKKAILEENPQKFSANTVKKINHLILQSIKYYGAFVDSYQRDGKLPEKFEDDDVRGILICYFYMARLNSKYFTNEKQTKLSYLHKERDCYQYVVDYCERNPDASQFVSDELNIAREMLGLFNAKVNKVLDSM